MPRKRLAPDALLALHCDIRTHAGTIAQIAARYGVSRRNVEYHKRRLRDPFRTEGVASDTDISECAAEVADRLAAVVDRERIERKQATRRVLAGDTSAVADVVARVPGLIYWGRNGRTVYAA